MVTGDTAVNTQYTEHDLLMDCLRYSERIPEFLRKTALGQIPTAAQLTSKSFLAYRWAKDVIGRPWPPGEAAIAQSAKWAYFYALQMIRGPWPPGEAAIAGTVGWANEYAHSVIRAP